MQEFDKLSAAEKELIERFATGSQRVPRLGRIQEQGIAPFFVYFLISGWVTSAIMLPNGSQQIVKVHLPGDLLGFPSLALRKTADSLTAITEAVVAKIPVTVIGSILASMPHLASMLFLSSQKERVALMDALTAMGRTSAVSRLAAFVIDIFERATAASLCNGQSFLLPLSQQQIGDLAGISAVHVNRSIRQLRESGMLSWDKQQVTIRNRAGLERLAVRADRSLAYNPAWLPKAVSPLPDEVA